MTSRERILTAVNHREPDRVPIDFGGTVVSGAHVSCVAALREYYALEKRPVKVHEPFQMVGWIDEDLKQAIGVDVDAAMPWKTLFGFANERWKCWRMPDGLEILVPGDFNTTTAPNGDLLIYPEGDLSAPPSGRMPKGGYFFDAIIRQEPIDEDKLNPEDNLEEFGPITAEELVHLRRAVTEASSGRRAVITNFGGTWFGDISVIPAPFLKHPKGIRDVAEWYVSTHTRRDYIHKVFSAQCEIALANLEKVHAAIGGLIDVLFVCGTDFGTQTSSFCSVPAFRELYFPYYQRVNEWIHRHTHWKTFKHCCGAIEKFMDAFIECGFEIINPVQCSAAGMDAALLKRKYGDRIVFWGGGVDTQQTLTLGTPEQVREQVLRRCEIFSRNGGFVFCAVHNIQATTPVENIVAMIEAVHEFNGVPAWR